jgi:hypothetical protein
MMTKMTEAAAGGHWQPLMAWCGAGVRRPEAAEMGIKWKWEQCGYDKWKFLFSKVVRRVYFQSYPTAFPHIFGKFLAGCDYTFRPLASLRSSY